MSIQDGEFFIDFNTKVAAPKLQAVRVRIDSVLITKMDKQLHINLCEHPLYRELERYVKANPYRPAQSDGPED